MLACELLCRPHAEKDLIDRIGRASIGQARPADLSERFRAYRCETRWMQARNNGRICKSGLFPQGFCGYQDPVFQGPLVSRAREAWWGKGDRALYVVFKRSDETSILHGEGKQLQMVKTRDRPSGSNSNSKTRLVPFY